MELYSEAQWGDDVIINKSGKRTWLATLNEKNIVWTYQIGWGYSGRTYHKPADYCMLPQNPILHKSSDQRKWLPEVKRNVWTVSQRNLYKWPDDQVLTMWMKEKFFFLIVKATNLVLTSKPNKRFQFCKRELDWRYNQAKYLQIHTLCISLWNFLWKVRSDMENGPKAYRAPVVFHKDSFTRMNLPEKVASL